MDTLFLEDAVISAIVYTCGSARVTRSVSIKIDQGKSVLGSAPLPSAIDLQSLQVTIARTEHKIKIESTETRLELVEDEERKSQHSKDLAQSADRIFQLSQELKLITGTIQTQKDTLTFLAQMREQSVKVAAGQKHEGKIDIETWEQAVESIESRSHKARAEINRLETEERNQKKKIEEEQRKYQELQNKGPQQNYVKRAFITVFAEEACDEVEMQLTYNVSDAYWQPVYRIGADVAQKSLELELFASVCQSTGENWQDISLSFSSARPDIGTDIPALLPWYINISDIPSQPVTSSNVPMSAQNILSAGRTKGKSAKSSGAVTVFPASSSANIPSDNQKHKIPVTSFHSTFELKYIAIPKIIPHSFLQAKMIHTADFPLLPGIAEVSIGNSYMGKGMMRLTAPGQEMELSLGVDDQIKVSLQLVENKSERKWRGNRVQKKNVYRISVTNYSDDQISLTVYDQLPVSQTPQIDVNYGKEASRALCGAEFPGQLRWNVDLAKGEHWQTEFDFTIEYPEEMKQQLQMDNRKIRYNVKQMMPQGSHGDYESVDCEEELDLLLDL